MSIHLCFTAYGPGLLLLSWLFCYNKKHSRNGTGKKLKFLAFSIPFWLCLSFLSEANTIEAGYPGIPRSINMGVTCPAMQRPVFEEGGRQVRLSANNCQLHRPNTIPIFCAAVCRDYRLRTLFNFCESNFYYSICARSSSALFGDR